MKSRNTVGNTENPGCDDIDERVFSGMCCASSSAAPEVSLGNPDEGMSSWMGSSCTDERVSSGMCCPSSAAAPEVSLGDSMLDKGMVSWMS